MDKMLVGNEWQQFSNCYKWNIFADYLMYFVHFETQYCAWLGCCAYHPALQKLIISKAACLLHAYYRLYVTNRPTQEWSFTWVIIYTLSMPCLWIKLRISL